VSGLERTPAFMRSPTCRHHGVSCCIRAASITHSSAGMENYS
jgi:hypothetical protein